SDRADGNDFWQYIANLAPVYNETTTYSRYLEPTAPESSGFTWVVKTGGADADKPMLSYHHSGSACDRAVPHVMSRLPMAEPHFGWFNVLVALGFISVLCAWSTFAARRLFFGDIEIESPPTQYDQEGLPLVARPDRLDLPPDLAWAKN